MPVCLSNIFSNSYIGLSKFDNVEAKNLHFSPDVSGNQIVYNVPSGKKVLLLGMTAGNTTAASISLVPGVCVSGVYSRFIAETSPAAMSVSMVNSSAYLYCSGESIYVYTTASGLNLYCKALEFNSSSNIQAIKKIDSWTSGNNLVYTAPSKGTVILDANGNLNGSAIQSFRYFNQSTAARNFKLFIVPNGQSTDTHNYLYPATTTVAHNAGAAIVGNFMSSGDSLYAYVDGSGQQTLFACGIEL